MLIAGTVPITYHATCGWCEEGVLEFLVDCDNTWPSVKSAVSTNYEAGCVSRAENGHYQDGCEDNCTYSVIFNWDQAKVNQQKIAGVR